MTPAIRPYRPADLPALYDICLRTAAAGGDASGDYPEEDHELLGTLFAAPYAVLEPESTFVVDDGSGQAVGYVLGTADTAGFVERFRDEWLPTVADRWPAPEGEPATPTEVMAWLLHTPERMVVPALAGYPAHLHIDVLPDYQGAGNGRALMDALLGSLAARGVPAVHLGMLTENVAARAFYDRLGFHEIAVPDAGVLTYLGRATS
ncbi:GNAT family N-acetyltransferase [Streptomyces cocklensis]|uniref:Acetyltransferase OgpAT n=1 Tax=Actinacidiphila cocklensis TaxID=887465 RepID=A0A9W4GU05_9ACTN|nr:GNAT family N-acetyltransferase [Actinacidiphila cocklensis]MDD1061716.1 GNAT family N-acetyltransferase [Actinacidiphila cocklensis]WSX75971.1 GNAT family N-acetyltransferase [Streptomyces sp. NBC_00899]CAG6396325.1 Putative acetyltransferase OgpAT [Actinacidiphila cocklensis]